ncbi:hypothetical protein SUGI_0121520 [Cryptomeria japonica]|nr:hypothetical protein SUGI_0121520 [Cryptomeria japonica]
MLFLTFYEMFFDEPFRESADFSFCRSFSDRQESPGKQKRSAGDNMNYSSEFEICNVNSVNHGCEADLNETLNSADELFVDG